MITNAIPSYQIVNQTTNQSIETERTVINLDTKATLGKQYLLSGFGPDEYVIYKESWKTIKLQNKLSHEFVVAHKLDTKVKEPNEQLFHVVSPISNNNNTVQSSIDNKCSTIFLTTIFNDSEFEQKEAVIVCDENFPLNFFPKILKGSYLEEQYTSYLKIKPFLNKDIFNHQQLSIQVLSYQILGQLSDFLWELTETRALRISHSNLSSVPTSLGNLTHLKFLSLASNRLSELPEQIGNLKFLETLSLRDNKLDSLPDRIGDLVNLSMLRLENNQLNKLPDSIGELNCLEFLDLRHNKLKSVPPSIFKLPSTCKVNLAGNPLPLAVEKEVLNITQQPTYCGPQIDLGSIGWLAKEMELEVELEAKK